MTQQVINTGAVANDGTGESLRNAFDAVNNNFANIWTAGPVDSQVVISNNRISTTVQNLALVLAGNGVGTITVGSTVAPGIDSVYDLGTANSQFDSVYSRYFYGNGAFLSGISNGSGSATSVTFSATPPAVANIGDIWIQSDTGIQYLYFNDNTSNQWAELEAYQSFSSGGTGNANVDLTNVSSDIIPSNNNSYSLGNSVRQWKDLWVSNSTIYLNSLPITADGANLKVNGNTVLTTSSPLSFSNLSVTGNVSANAVYTNNYFYANGAPFPQGSNSLPGTTISLKDNVIATTTLNQNLVLSANGVGNVQTNSSIMPDATQVRDIGSASNKFNSIYAGYYYGNGSQLTGISAGNSNSIISGNSNVKIVTAGGNVTIGIGGIGNIVVVSGAGEYVTGVVSASGNITAPYFVGNGSLLTGITTVVAANTAQTVTANAQANITSVGTLTSLSVTGTVQGGNVLTSGIVSTTGNITGNYFIGNGSQLTGLAATYGNANVVANLAALGSNPVSTTGNVTGGNLVTGGVVSFAGGSRLSPIGANLDIFAGAGAYVNLTTSDESSRMGVDSTGGYITTAGGSWDFDTTGTLTVPATNVVPGRISTQTTVASEKGFDLRITAGNTNGCSVSGGDMYLSAGVGYNGISHNGGNVNIVTGDRYGNIVGNIWKFGSTGILTLPLGNVKIKDTVGNSVAFGLNAGFSLQGIEAVAIGSYAGNNRQGNNSVAIGNTAGAGGSVSTNYVSGAESPSTTLVVVSTTGIGPGMIISGTGFFGNITVVTVTNSTTLELSASAGFTPSGTLTFTGSQGANAVAIGQGAGSTNQGTGAVAIGASAGYTNQGNNSIILNATGANLDQITANTFTVAPVRNDVANTAQVMFYNATSKEITYGNVISVAGNITGNYFIGNGSQLTGIVSSYGNANVVANLASLGSNPVSTTGNVSGNYFIGNGSQLTSVATQVTGSWTLAAGTNTVSLSVPGPGTYSIWVNGNIPNGIVVYTATIVVTNNNVPVVGSSYGWYYAAGNALVLTAIPNQVVGTENNISTAVVATTTANVFTFGITNTSGSSQIVNYGYTKL